jgi:hypothetical protein
MPNPVCKVAVLNDSAVTGRTPARQIALPKVRGQLARATARSSPADRRAINRTLRYHLMFMLPLGFLGACFTLKEIINVLRG